MCRVEERVYINGEGHRSKFEDAFPCSHARKGRLCSNVKKNTTEYYPKKPIISRDDSPSPINPPTPTGTGSYLVEQRRPSSSGGRPSTRDGPRQIIIEFGSNKTKKYAGNSHKRSFLHGNSADDLAFESPGSDASHTIRTGYPDAPLSPQTAVFGHTDDYITNPGPSHGSHHRHTSSSSSYTGSSRTPSLYVTSDPDYESPPTTRSTKLRPAIHYPSTSGAQSSPSKSRTRGGTSSANYKVTEVSPHGNSHEDYSPDSLAPHDYQDFADRSASSHASSGASSKSRKGKEPEQPRKGKDSERRRQEELAREAADAENVKQVRFELERPKARAQERAETLLAEKEKQRADEREEARRRKERERAPEPAKPQKKEKSYPPTSMVSTKRPSASRRGSVSMTQAQQDEQRRLLAAELDHMQGESRATEAREREERSAALMLQQQDTSYYNPRTGGLPSSAPAVAHRGSVSSDARPTPLGRSNSRRTSISQQKPPPINTQTSPDYVQPVTGSARARGPPPLSFPSNFNTRPTSARRPSFSSQDNPFAVPARLSGTSVENAFATLPPVISPPVTVHQDPYNTRNLREALPSRETADNRNSIQRRGEDVIKAAGSHSAARKATRAMGRAAGYEDDYATDDDQVTHGHPRRRYP
jgi:chemotaxis protein histidine kinase CheA